MNLGYQTWPARFSEYYIHFFSFLFNLKIVFVSQAVLMYNFIPALRRQRQVNFCKFEASLVEKVTGESKRHTQKKNPYPHNCFCLFVLRKDMGSSDWPKFFVRQTPKCWDYRHARWWLVYFCWWWWFCVLFFAFFSFKTGSHYVIKVVLELTM